MNSLCFVLVLLTTQIIYTKEVSSFDQNKTASTSTSSRPAPEDLYHGIDFDKVELFKDYDELPIDSQDTTSTSNQIKRPINEPNLSKNGPSATIKGNQTPPKIFGDYDINELQLDKYKVMVSPNRYKTINATNVRFLNQNSGLVNNPGGSEVKMTNYQVRPNGANTSGTEAANSGKNPVSVPGSMINTDSNNSVTPIPWIISPACLQQNESKYLFSAIFNKKPTVHLLTADNGTTLNSQTPKIVINEDSVTMSAGDATLPNDGYVKMNSSNIAKNQVLTKTPNSVAVAITNDNTTPVQNSTLKLKIEESILKGLTEFTKTIQNSTKPLITVAPSKVNNSIAIPGEVNTNEANKKTKPPILGQPNAAAQPIQPQTTQLIPHLQANIPVKTPTVTINAQGTKKVEPIPLFVLENNLLQTPTPAGTVATAFRKSQQAIADILNSELGERSFFPSELNQNFKRPTEKKTVSDLMTLKETNVQSSDLLYELFKNITMTNVINEDLNRKLLNESQIHTQQNQQLIESNSDILNVLKNKNE